MRGTNFSLLDKTRQKNRRLYKQIKNAESLVWIKRIERQPQRGHDCYQNKRPPSSGKTPIRNWFYTGICNKGRSNRRGKKMASRTPRKRALGSKFHTKWIKQLPVGEKRFLRKLTLTKNRTPFSNREKITMQILFIISR